jgi:hypothetical protein
LYVPGGQCSFSLGESMERLKNYVHLIRI